MHSYGICQLRGHFLGFYLRGEVRLGSFCSQSPSTNRRQSKAPLQKALSQLWSAYLWSLEDTYKSTESPSRRWQQEAKKHHSLQYGRPAWGKAAKRGRSWSSSRSLLHRWQAPGPEGILISHQWQIYALLMERASRGFAYRLLQLYWILQEQQTLVD